jgi:hypothetical protein
MVTESKSSIDPTTDPAAHPKGYGNIYTPHAGSMIIQVQRESGLQNRTIILSQRQVRILRFLTSRSGKFIVAGIACALLLIGFEAARVPLLTVRIASLQRTATRLDTLEHSITELQKRYDQVQHMLGATPQIALTPAEPTVVRHGSSSGSSSGPSTRSSRTRHSAPPAVQAAAEPAVEPAASDSTVPATVPATVPDTADKSSLPTD